MKKVSIIVAVYKVEKYLNRCIESIINQTYENIEIILVDDGSPDSCPILCDNWAKKDGRIKVIHKENGGLSDARNKGLEVATGEYVGFIDGDDEISSSMFEKLMKIVEENNAEIGICQFARFIDGSVPNYTIVDDCTIIDKDEALKEVLTEKIGNHICNKLFKRGLFDNTLFTKGVAYEDIFIFYKLLLKSKNIAITNSKLYGYMQRRDSITNNCTVKNVRDYIKANNTRYESLKNNKELRDYLNISMVKCGYILHVKAASTRDREFFFSDEMLTEYKKLKKTISLRNIKFYLEDSSFKTKVYKVLLLINRNLFFKLITRKN